MYTGPWPDPGWRPAARRAAGLVIPGELPRLLSGGGVPRILVLRSIFIGLAGATALLAAVLAFVPGEAPPAGGPVNVPGMLVVGAILAIWGTRWLGSRPLECQEPAELAQRYTARFSLGMVLAESAVLLGFVGAFLVGARWPLVVGAALTAAGFAVVAPTGADVEAIERQLTDAGCGFSIREALYAAPAPGTPPAREA